MRVRREEGGEKRGREKVTRKIQSKEEWVQERWGRETEREREMRWGEVRKVAKFSRRKLAEFQGNGYCLPVAMETGAKGNSAAGSRASPLFSAGLSMLKSPFQMTVRSTGRLLTSIPSYEYCNHGD